MKLDSRKLHLLLRIIISIIFIFSAISKLAGPENFLKEVGKLSFFSPSLDVFIGYSFIIFEFILGILLLFKFNNKTLLLVGITVFLLSCYLGYKVITNDVSDCGCFGNYIYRSNFSAFIQDLFILITLVYLYE